VPSLELRQAEGATSAVIGDGGGTALVKEIAIERGSAPSASQEIRAALKMDELERSRPVFQENSGAAEHGISAARLGEESAKDGRFRRSASFEARASQGVDEAHRALEAAPQGQALIPGRQAPSPSDEIAVAPANDEVQLKDQINQKKVASLQPGMQDKHERDVEPQAPPQRNKAAVERPDNKIIVPSKTINTAAIIIPGNKQKARPERAALSARAALLGHSLDRTMLTAAPGG
jgi:hypothetical protein